jgi:arylformamidase
MCAYADHRECGAVAEQFVQVFDAAEIVDLSQPLENGIPAFPTHPKFFQMRWCSMGNAAEMNQLLLSDHSGTHLDAPSHYVPPGNRARRTIDEVPLDRFMGRALKLTFGPFEPCNAQVDADAIRACERDHLAIKANDVVLMDFQWGHRWALDEAGYSFLDSWPGLSRSAAEYLVEKKVKLVGTDCVSIDPGDGGDNLAAHYCLLPEGVLILENACNLSRLNPVSFFMALPLRLAGGTGSPVRAIAMQAGTMASS